MTPFFSVVIPVYNRAQLVGDTIKSVLAQTEQDFEIIVVDDGSKDDLKTVIKSFADPRLVFLRQENGGGGKARNTGIDAARGSFIAFLDSDDQFLPHHLAAMRRLLEGTTHTGGYSRFIVDRGEGRVIYKPHRAVRDDENIATYLLCDRGFIATSVIVVPAEVARAIRFNENLPAAEDTDFLIRAALGGTRFVMAETPSLYWRDFYDPNRLSIGRRCASMKDWIESLRGQIPEKAYYGCLGWAYAKYVAMEAPFAAFRLWLNAVRHGCYRPQVAVIVFLQIFLGDKGYRHLADSAIGWLGPLWNRRTKS